MGKSFALILVNQDGEQADAEWGHSWTIKVGESFYLKLKNEEGEAVSVDWSAGKDGYVTISGNRITGKARGTVTVSCEFEGQTYSCIVRVKSA